ncbi:MAG: Cytochrome c oxidase assembly protein cox19 [Paramarteilia canceri]
MVRDQPRIPKFPPDRGSFALDIEGVCKEQMLVYFKCLTENKNKSFECIQEQKDILNCRMDNNLMERESFEDLGFKQ